MRYRRVVVLVTVVALLAGCAPPDQTPAPSVREPFGPATVTRATETLAEAGVTVRIRPSEAPLVDVAAPSRVALLRLQVRNMALEAHAGGGTLGRDLDQFVEAAGGPPVSRLIAGWARTADTPASSAAATLLGNVGSVEPEDLAIPGLAVTLFLADLVGTSSAAGPTSIRLAGGPVLAQAAGDFCAEVGTYLSGVLEGVLDPDIDLEPEWLREAIDLYGGTLTVEPDQLRNAVAAMALLVYATSISRPWVPVLLASPNAVHYIVGEDELTSPTKEFRLSVDTGTASLAEEAAECAELGQIALPDSEVEGSRLTWFVDALRPHAAVEKPSEPFKTTMDVELDENGMAILEYQTKSELPELHRNGILRTAHPVVGVVVQRKEIEEVQNVVRRMLTGGDFGSAAPAVAAAFARLEQPLLARLHPATAATVEVTWHDDPDPTPAPSARPDPPLTVPCAEGCGGSNGDPHLMTIDQTPYDFQAAGEFVLLRSADGTIEIQARQEPYEDSANVTINTAVAMRIGTRRFGVYVDAAAGLRARLDGADIDAVNPTQVPGGGLITAVDGGWRVDLADGTVVWALGLRSYGINIVVEPSRDLRPSAAGIIGPVPAGSLGIPALPDGTAVPATDDPRQRYEAIYLTFADAWRVTDATSLFDYESGASTADFTIRGFPREEDLVGLEDLTDAQRAAGEAACAGVADPVLRAQCVFDVGLTADRGFADSYRIVEAQTVPASATLLRVVNVYDDGVGEVESLDVYARSNEGQALLVSVPFGQVSPWVDPGYTEFEGRRTSSIVVKRPGRLDSLVEHLDVLSPGDRATVIVTAASPDIVGPDGGRGALWSTILEQGPEFPLRDAPPGQALLVVDGRGLEATLPDLDFLSASAGNGCLLGTDPDPVFPAPQPVGAGTQGLLVVEPGRRTLTIHPAPPLGTLPACDDAPLAPGIPVELAAGDRYLVVLFASASEGILRTLGIPLLRPGPAGPEPSPGVTSPPAVATERPRAP